MANSDKNILITPNRNLSGIPEITFTGAGNSSMSMRISDSSTGTINFESSGKNRFSIDSNLSGSLVGVADTYGNPLLNTDANNSIFFNKTTEINCSGGLKLPVISSESIPPAEPGLLIYDRTEQSLRIGINTLGGWTSAGTNQIVKNGLVLNVDAGRLDSYPRSGSVWYDVSGAGNDLTLTNGPSYDTTDNIPSFSFNGSNQYAMITGFYGTSARMTLSCWFRTVSTQTNKYLMAFSANLGTGSNGYDLTIQSGQIGSYVAMTGNGGGNVNTTFNFYDNSWHMLTTVVDAYTHRLFFDGYQINFRTGLTGGVNIESTRQLTVGSWANGANNFQGNIACAHVYNRPLTPAEVRQNFEAQRYRFGA